MTDLRAVPATDPTSPTATGCALTASRTVRVVTRKGVTAFDTGVTWWTCTCRPAGPKVADPARVLHAGQPLPDDVVSPGAPTVPSQRSEKP